MAKGIEQFYRKEAWKHYVANQDDFPIIPRYASNRVMPKLGMLAVISGLAVYILSAIPHSETVNLICRPEEQPQKDSTDAEKYRLLIREQKDPYVVSAREVVKDREKPKYITQNARPCGGEREVSIDAVVIENRGQGKRVR